MKTITRVSNGAIKALVALGLFFNLAIYSTAQEYYYKKANEYWSIGWKESAVREFNNGVSAGEKKCILPLAYCYIKEIGTPRNLAKAESLLQSGAQSDPVTCFLASYIYDGGNLRPYELRKYHYNLYEVGVSVNVYNFARSYDEEMIIPSNPTKALKYARQYHKLENSEKSQRWKDYVELKCYLHGIGGVSQDIDKALKIKREYSNDDDFSIEEYTNYMLQFSESLRDLGEIVNFMQMSGNQAWINYQDPEYYYDLVNNSYRAQDYNVQFLGLFNDLYAEWVAGLETEQQRKAKYESANPQEKKAINIGLAFKSHELGYIKVDESNSNSRIVDLENLISLSPSDSITNVARIAWTRLKVAELLKKSYYRQQVTNCVKRSDVRELFSHPNYAEVKGYDRYFLEKHSDKWYSNSSAIKLFITTQKSAIIQSLKEMDLLDLSDFNIDNITRYNLSDYKNDLQVLIEDNKIMFGRLSNIISKAQANVRDMEAFVKFLSDEKASKVSIDDYFRLQSNRISECRTYVTKCLNNFAAERRQIESDVENFKHISAEDYALYQKFQIIAQTGKFKKIKAEEVQRLLTDVLYPSIELCKKAIKVYPRPNTSEILKSLNEQQDICLLLANYYAGTLKVSDCDTVTKHYNSTDYSLLISNLKAAQEKLDRSRK